VYEEFVAIEKPAWESKEVIEFHIPVSDTASIYNTAICIRHTGQYDYSNLFLFVTALAPDGKSVRDTLEITLADEHGKWLGKGAASVFTQYHSYRQQVKFPVSGIYTIRIEQAMWAQQLKFITEVGFLLEKAGSKD
jgi:gliding motility-associated lipoprotein GldH